MWREANITWLYKGKGNTNSPLTNVHQSVVSSEQTEFVTSVAMFAPAAYFGLAAHIGLPSRWRELCSSAATSQRPPPTPSSEQLTISARHSVINASIHCLNELRQPDFLPTTREAQYNYVALKAQKDEAVRKQQSDTQPSSTLKRKRKWAVQHSSLDIVEGGYVNLDHTMRPTTTFCSNSGVRGAHMALARSFYTPATRSITVVLRQYSSFSPIRFLARVAVVGACTGLRDQYRVLLIVLHL